MEIVLTPVHQKIAFFFAKLNELVTATNKKIKVVEISGHTKISIRGDLLIPFAVHFWMT